MFMLIWSELDLEVNEAILILLTIVWPAAPPVFRLGRYVLEDKTELIIPLLLLVFLPPVAPYVLPLDVNESFLFLGIARVEARTHA